MLQSRTLLNVDYDGLSGAESEQDLVIPRFIAEALGGTWRLEKMTAVKQKPERNLFTIKKQGSSLDPDSQDGNLRSAQCAFQVESIEAHCLFRGNFPLLLEKLSSKASFNITAFGK